MHNHKQGVFYSTEVLVGTVKTYVDADGAPRVEGAAETKPA